jgi:hypothetical protein
MSEDKQQSKISELSSKRENCVKSSLVLVETAA